MNREEALEKIKALEEYIKAFDNEVGVEEDDIFLLSVEEYRRYRDDIPHVKCYWWLKDKGCSFDRTSVACVHKDKSIEHYGASVYYENAVRPALKYTKIKPEISKSREKDCFIWNEVKWKIIDKEKEIAISYMPITFDKFDNSVNDYEISYIRDWLLDWYKEGVKNEID